MPKLSDVSPLLNRHLDSRSEGERARLFVKLTRKEVAAQIRQLREKRHLTQVEFAKRCNMKQSAVSRIEQAEYSGWTFKTLARVAEKLNARLRIGFEPIEEITLQMKTEKDAEFEPAAIQLRYPPQQGAAKSRLKSRSRSKVRIQA